jgi:hypothetical protein
LIRGCLSPVLVLTLLSGCRVAVAAPVDALLSVEDTYSRVIVRRAMQDALGVSSITLAKDAFSKDSLLTLEPRAFQKIGRPDADARMPGPPEQFRLHLLDGHCALLRVRTGVSIPLVDVLCQPVGIEAGD